MCEGLLRSLITLLLCSMVCCGKRADEAQRALETHHAREIRAVAKQDEEKHLTGVIELARRLAPHIEVGDAPSLEKHLTKARRPPRGVRELFASPLTFVAATNADGVVLARNGRADDLVGMNLSRYPIVQQALAGGPPSDAVVEFENPRDPRDPSVVWMFAAPSVHKGKVAGVVVLGFPLWRWSQRLSKQMQLDHAKEQGIILWAYVYRGSKLHHLGDPPDLTQEVPGAKARREGLRRHPKGYSGQLSQYGRWYAYHVLPLPSVDDDVGVILFRSDP